MKFWNLAVGWCDKICSSNAVGTHCSFPINIHTRTRGKPIFFSSLLRKVMGSKWYFLCKLWRVNRQMVTCCFIYSRQLGHATLAKVDAAVFTSASSLLCSGEFCFLYSHFLRTQLWENTNLCPIRAIDGKFLRNYVEPRNKIPTFLKLKIDII